MPLQNRVTPFGEIVAVSERGTMMGNRGILHDDCGRVRRYSAGTLWICCLLEFRGRRDPVMAPGHYTRLFFLDEPTALAAGHRPCAYCRRDEYRAFQSAWAAGSHHLGLGPTPHAAQIDRVLHAERVGGRAVKRLHPAPLEQLPDGVFVTPRPTEIHLRRVYRALDGSWALLPRGYGGWHEDVDAFLLWGGTLWRWTPGGYREAGSVHPGPVLSLTPPSIVAALASGYTPRRPLGLE